MWNVELLVACNWKWQITMGNWAILWVLFVPSSCRSCTLTFVHFKMLLKPFCTTKSRISNNNTLLTYWHFSNDTNNSFMYVRRNHSVHKLQCRLPVWCGVKLRYLWKETRLVIKTTTALYASVPTRKEEKEYLTLRNIYAIKMLKL